MSQTPPFEPVITNQPEPTRWHLIVGVIGLVYAILGTCAYSFFGLGIALNNWVVSLMGIKNPPAMPNAVYAAFTSVAGLALGILLIVGSVKLIRRQASCAKVLMTWVIARLLLVVIGLVGGFMTLQAQVDYGQQWDEAVRTMIEERQAGASKQMPPFNRERQELMARWSTIGISVIVTAFPLFMGILLTNPRKKEEIESWRNMSR